MLPLESIVFVREKIEKRFVAIIQSLYSFPETEGPSKEDKHLFHYLQRPRSRSHLGHTIITKYAYNL